MGLERRQAHKGTGFGLVTLVVLCLICLAFFVLWRADSPRLVRLRMAISDRFAPTIETGTAPVIEGTALVRDYRSVSELRIENERLRAEVQRMLAWREVAEQLEEENARLRALNNVQLAPRISVITGEVIADSGSAFSQSALLNIGADKGVEDGSAAMDDQGVVGRVVGVGRHTARVVLLSDPTSRVPVNIGTVAQRAILAGDNGIKPRIEFLTSTEGIKVGDRVVTSGDGGVFPPNLLVGRIADVGRRYARVELAANFHRLQFIRILKLRPQKADAGEAGLILSKPDSKPEAKPVTPLTKPAAGRSQ